MSTPLRVTLDRQSEISLADQIYLGIRDAILHSKLESKTRLPSWRDLASQLGVSRGTVKRSYERLVDDQLVESRGAAGTWVSSFIPEPREIVANESVRVPGLFYDFESRPLTFQMGIPAQDEFPAKAWASAWRSAFTTAENSPLIYPDPRGILQFRREIAAYLAVARGIRCIPDQVLITSGFTGALGIAIQALGLAGGRAWMEEPGYPRTFQALRQCDMEISVVRVDDQGMDVTSGVSKLPSPTVAIVTPGQQAPLGMTMSPARRSELLEWARGTGAWIIEDDYVGELQLEGRATAALASNDPDGRVVYIGSFSKTLSPTLRTGFMVVPIEQVRKFTDYAANVAPAASPITQNAIQRFMSHGHYLRHLRRMKQLYFERKQLMTEVLHTHMGSEFEIQHHGALSVRMFFKSEIDDVAVTAKAEARNLGPVPLSLWYRGEARRRGLLLGITNVSERTIIADCEKLAAAIRDAHQPK